MGPTELHLALGRLQCHGAALTYRCLVIGEVNVLCEGPHTLRGPRRLQLSPPQLWRRVHRQSNIEWLSVSNKWSTVPPRITLLLPPGQGS